MLIINLLLILITLIFFELIRWIVHVCYLVKISVLADNIKCKDDLLYLKLKDFEYVIAEVFKRQGYKVQMSSHFGEGGNGIILNDIYYVIAKKESYHNLIEPEEAKKLVKHMKDNNIHRGIIITLGDFKTSTKNYCYVNVIKCINGDQLMQIIKSAQALSTQSVFSK